MLDPISAQGKVDGLQLARELLDKAILLLDEVNLPLAAIHVSEAIDIIQSKLEASPQSE